MDRAEATGLGIALLGHVALLAALSLGFAAAVRPPILNEPMEVSFVEEVGPQSASETPATEAPAAPPAAIETLPDVAPPLPRAITAPPPPSVASTPTPRVVPRRPAPPAQVAAAKPPPARRSNRLTGLLNGVGEAETQSPSTTPRAAISGAARSSLGAEVKRQLKPHWKAPTGADAELLRTELVISLAPNGNVTDIRIVGTTGQTASNRPQVKLHQEQAVKAVRLASPFRLPPEYYDAWKQITTSFDKRLSQ